MTASSCAGVDAICRGLLDGGAETAYNYPGFFSHDIFKGLGGKRISLNERVAYAQAFGASLAGKRSVVTLKNVGLNIASDAFLHSIIAGVRAGMVTVVTDDISVWGSQESQDSRSYFDFFGGLWLEPASLQEAYDFAFNAFELSERFDVPVVIRLTNPFFELKGEFLRSRKKRIPAVYSEVRSDKFVVSPVYFKKQLKNLNLKNEAIKQSYARQPRDSKIQHPKGIIAVGTIEQSRLPIKDADIFKVSTYPLPSESLKKFIEGHDEVEVIECGGPYVAKQLYEIISIRHIKSSLPTVLGEKYPFTPWKRYRMFFDALVSIKPAMVVSDVTQFTFEENESAKASLSFGAAVSTSMGFAEAEPTQYAFSLSGDCSFLHEGIGVISEASRRNLKFGLVIFDNGGAWCTGGQECTGSIYEILKATNVKTFELVYEDSTEPEIRKILGEMRSFNGISILYVKVLMGSFKRD